MKKILSITFIFNFTLYWAQTTNTFPSSGNAAVGTVSPNFNMQLHGTTDYNVTVPGTPPTYDIFGNIIPGTAGYTVNHGKTARLGLTNTTTGTTSSDGLLIRMSGLNGVIENLEKQNVTINSSGAKLIFSGSSNRVWFFNLPSIPTSSAYAYANIMTTDNGLYIETQTDKKGLIVKNYSDASTAIEIYGANATRSNFRVYGSGLVRAREVIIDLALWPDYVFLPGYKLKTLKEIEEFIGKHGHLPGVPSAEEVATDGVSLGEMNKILLEKIEELTLHLIEQQKAIEEQQKRIELLEIKK